MLNEDDSIDTGTFINGELDGQGSRIKKDKTIEEGEFRRGKI